jgi:Uncharacterized protein conserved in bacteria (DUF2255)
MQSSIEGDEMMRGAVLYGARDERFEERATPKIVGPTDVINDGIDDAYRAKYGGSPYLSPMIGARARSATVRVMPRKTKA